MTRFDLFGKMTYIMKKNIGYIELKSTLKFMPKSGLEMIFEDLEKRRDFSRKPLLEAIRRHVVHSEKHYQSVIVDTNKGKTKEILESLSVFSALKNIGKN